MYTFWVVRIYHENVTVVSHVIAQVRSKEAATSTTELVRDGCVLNPATNTVAELDFVFSVSPSFCHLPGTGWINFERFVREFRKLSTTELIFYHYVYETNKRTK